jgi:hypothetical protein
MTPESCHPYNLDGEYLDSSGYSSEIGIYHLAPPIDARPPTDPVQLHREAQDWIWNFEFVLSFAAHPQTFKKPIWESFLRYGVLLQRAYYENDSIVDAIGFIREQWNRLRAIHDHPPEQIAGVIATIPKYDFTSAERQLANWFHAKGEDQFILYATVDAATCDVEEVPSRIALSDVEQRAVDAITNARRRLKGAELYYLAEGDKQKQAPAWYRTMLSGLVEKGVLVGPERRGPASEGYALNEPTESASATAGESRNSQQGFSTIKSLVPRTQLVCVRKLRAEKF